MDNQNGYNYNNGFNGFDSNFYMQREAKKKEEKRKIRHMGSYTGFALLGFILIQNIIAIIMRATGFTVLYQSNPLLSTGVDIILSIIELLVPFLVFGTLMKNETGTHELLPLNRPIDTKLSVLGVFSGIGICMLANIVTSYMTLILKVFGIELLLPDIAFPNGTFGFVLSVVRVAVTAAIIEEICLRGCVMQPLRKYGDGFAIVASACAFGLMHMNLIQAPFAMIVGLGLGYIAIKTDSLLTVMIIHGINNFISTCVSYIMKTGVSEQAVSVIYAYILYGFIAVGAVCFFLFVKRARVLNPGRSASGILSAGEKARAFVSTPALIIAILIMFYYTSKFIAVG